MTMTWDEFYGHVMVVFSSAMEWRGESGIYWEHGTAEYYQKTWTTGGRCGGNCWDAAADQEIYPDPEPDMNLLDNLLEEVCPNLGVKQYRMLLSQVVQITDRSDYEYYGNYTDYGIKTIMFRDVYDSLVDMGVI